MIKSWKIESLPSARDANRHRISIEVEFERDIDRFINEIAKLGIKLGIPLPTNDAKTKYDMFIYELVSEKKEQLSMLLKKYEMLQVEKQEKVKIPISVLNLKEEFTFNNFIVGENNRFAYSASIAVAQNPGEQYNPLFIHGGVGLGKTHLLQAIGHEIKKNYVDKSIYYTSARDFMDEVVDAISKGTIRELRAKYKMIDVLLIDDVQFLAGSEATQEEFFHIFNELHLAKKQVVLTSDRLPKLLTTLEDRLRSRFEWGLIVDIKQPSLETRVAILKKKSEMVNLTIDDEILLTVAKILKSNIRELEGFVRRVQAYAQLTGQEINVELAEQVMRELLPPEEEEGKKEEKEQKPTITPKKIYVSPTKQITTTPTPVSPISIEQKPAPTVSEDLSLRAVDVVFFYPTGRITDLANAKDRFRTVIQKQNLKFRLQSIFDQEYMSENPNYQKMVEMCKTAGVKVAIVLGPPPNNKITSDEFYSSLLPLMEWAEVSLLYLPWHELEKNYKYLNLALDIVLSTSKIGT